MLSEFIVDNKLPAAFASTARQWFVPIAQKILAQTKSQQKPVFIGINGCQGSGKSTLAAYLNHYLTKEQSCTVVNLSLDDFYLSQQERKKLAESIHPLLKTRGVPGTHNIALLAHTLHCLKHDQLVALPSFDKATDNPVPENLWPTSPHNIDVVIFEGWCWGVLPQNNDSLASAVNDLEKTQDGTGFWRSYVNQKLAQDYQPLYAFIDKWVMLQAPSFDCVKAWRWQQEQKLIETIKENSQGSNTKNEVMTQTQVINFISYFQRLTEHALDTLPEHCDVVFKLDENRKICSQLGTF